MSKSAWVCFFILIAMRSPTMLGAQPVFEVRGIDNEPLTAATAPSLANGTDFGNQSVGVAITRKFVIRNQGDQTLHLTGSRRMGSSRFAFRFSTASIAPGETHVVEVRFLPDDVRSYRATLLLLADGLDAFVLNMQGSGTRGQ